MRAGFQRDVHRLAAGPLAGAVQGFFFGVRTSAGLGVATGDQFAGDFISDHGPDGWIGRGGAEPASRHRERNGHHAGVELDLRGRWHGAVFLVSVFPVGGALGRIEVGWRFEAVGNLAENFLEVCCLTEIAVNGGETDVGHWIGTLERFHDQFADGG